MSDEPEGAKSQSITHSITQYAGGEVASRRGGVNRWLLVVYAILALWAVYYVVAHWGGLGPGLAR